MLKVGITPFPLSDRAVYLFLHGKGSIGVGKVYLVGAGPGDPDLLTIRAKMLLERCDVVLYDALVPPAILNVVNPSAQLMPVGKRRGHHSIEQKDINQLLIAKAQEFKVVVRLKSGDPFMFGRGGEEVQDLQQAGIAVEVVPGITAGMATGIPLTHRELSSSVIFVTGHEDTAKDRPQVQWHKIAQSADTIVIYMGLHNLREITKALMAGGKPPHTPIAVIRQATQPEQAQIIATIGTITDVLSQTAFPPPAVAIIGQVVAFAHKHP
jgi:uroporphyrin-III C-methyltransferase